MPHLPLPIDPAAGVGTEAEIAGDEVVAEPLSTWMAEPAAGDRKPLDDAAGAAAAEHQAVGRVGNGAV